MGGPRSFSSPSLFQPRPGVFHLLASAAGPEMLIGMLFGTSSII